MKKIPNNPDPRTKGSRKLAKRKGASGSFMGIPIADPAVRPKGVTVKQIRRAVAEALKRA